MDRRPKGEAVKALRVSHRALERTLGRAPLKAADGDRVRLLWNGGAGTVVCRDNPTYMLVVRWDWGVESRIHEMYVEALD